MWSHSANIDKVWEYCAAKANKVESICADNKWSSDTGVSLGVGICKRLENNWGEWGELVTTTRDLEGVTALFPATSTRKLIMGSFGGIIINLTAPRELREEGLSLELLETLIFNAKLNHTRVICLWRNEEVVVNQAECLQDFCTISDPNTQNPWQKHGKPSTVDSATWSLAYWTASTEDRELLGNILSKPDDKPLEYNMYKETTGPLQTWICPFCHSPRSSNQQVFWGLQKEVLSGCMH